MHHLTPDPFFLLEEPKTLSILFERPRPGDLHISVGLQSNYLLGFQRPFSPPVIRPLFGQETRPGSRRAGERTGFCFPAFSFCL